jgi:hypothetical protein
LVGRSRTNAILISAAVGVGLAIVILLHRHAPEGLSPLGAAAMGSLHGPGFAAIAIAVYIGLRRRLSGWSRIGAAFGLCAGIGILAELSQVPGPRNADLSDLMTNVAGIFAGLALVAAFDRQVDLGESPWPRRLIAIAATAALAYVVAPTLWLTAAVATRKANVPVLLSFESPLESKLYDGMGTPAPVRVRAPAGWPSHGKLIGRGTASGRWGTMLAMAPYPDWRGYDAVSFVVASASAEPVGIEVMMRSNRKRYYRHFEAGPEPGRVRIEFDDILAKRPAFDFSKVTSLVVSAAEPGEPYVVLFDDFRLEAQDSR